MRVLKKDFKQTQNKVENSGKERISETRHPSDNSYTIEYNKRENAFYKEYGSSPWDLIDSDKTKGFVGEQNRIEQSVRIEENDFQFLSTTPFIVHLSFSYLYSKSVLRRARISCKATDEYLFIGGFRNRCTFYEEPQKPPSLLSNLLIK